MGLAKVEAHLGNHERARELVDRHNAMYLGAGVGGVLLGHMYEDTALIALLAGDEERFRENAALCAAQYRNGYNPALTARYEALMREAQQMHVSVSDELGQAAQYDDRSPVSELRSAFRTELETYMELSSRFQEILRLVVTRTGAIGGVLYLASEQGLRPRASTGDCPTSEALEAGVQEFWESETQPVGSQTLTLLSEHEIAPEDVIHRRITAEGKTLYLFILTNGESKDEQACGVLALASQPYRELEPDYAAIFALSQLMLEEETVVGFSLE